MFCDRFRRHPSERTSEEGLLGYTMVVCSHPYHSVEVFYFNVEEWGECFMRAVGPYWVNGYTIVCTAMN